MVYGERGREREFGVESGQYLLIAVFVLLLRQATDAQGVSPGVLFQLVYLLL